MRSEIIFQESLKGLKDDPKTSAVITAKPGKECSRKSTAALDGRIPYSFQMKKACKITGRVLAAPLKAGQSVTRLPLTNPCVGIAA